MRIHFLRLRRFSIVASFFVFASMPFMRGAHIRTRELQPGFPGCAAVTLSESESVQSDSDGCCSCSASAWVMDVTGVGRCDCWVVRFVVEEIRKCSLIVLWLVFVGPNYVVVFVATLSRLTLDPAVLTSFDFQHQGVERLASRWIDRPSAGTTWRISTSRTGRSCTSWSKRCPDSIHRFVSRASCFVLAPSAFSLDCSHTRGLRYVGCELHLVCKLMLQAKPL